MDYTTEVPSPTMVTEVPTPTTEVPTMGNTTEVPTTEVPTMGNTTEGPSMDNRTENRENTVVVLPVQLPLNWGVDEFYRCRLTIESKYKPASKAVLRYLNDEEREVFFRESPFGTLVKYHGDFKVSCVLIWYLMSRQIIVTDDNRDSDDLWMVVGNRPVRFSMSEYCLITGLNCSIEPTDLPASSGLFLSTNFEGKTRLTVGDLEAKMLQARQPTSPTSPPQIDVEKLKIASLYYYTSVFVEGCKRKETLVNPKWIGLVENLDSFNSYPFGRVTYLTALKSLKKENLMQKYQKLSGKGGYGTYFLSGFVLPLQILAYECFPGMASHYAHRKETGSCLMLPRMFHWTYIPSSWPSNRGPSFEHVDASFAAGLKDGQEYFGFLSPTSGEEIAPYYTASAFTDSQPDGATPTGRIIQLWSEGKTVSCQQGNDQPDDAEIDEGNSIIPSCRPTASVQHDGDGTVPTTAFHHADVDEDNSIPPTTAFRDHDQFQSQSQSNGLGELVTKLIGSVEHMRSEMLEDRLARAQTEKRIFEHLAEVRSEMLSERLARAETEKRIDELRSEVLSAQASTEKLISDLRSDIRSDFRADLLQESKHQTEAYDRISVELSEMRSERKGGPEMLGQTKLQDSLNHITEALELHKTGLESSTELLVDLIGKLNPKTAAALSSGGEERQPPPLTMGGPSSSGVEEKTEPAQKKMKLAKEPGRLLEKIIEEPPKGQRKTRTSKKATTPMHSLSANERAIHNFVKKNGGDKK